MANLFVFLLLVSIVCLIIGLISPTVFVRLLKRETTRKKIGLIFGVAILTSFLLIGITAEPKEEVEQPVQPETKEPIEKVKAQQEPTLEPEKTIELSQEKAQKTEQREPIKLKPTLEPTLKPGATLEPTLKPGATLGEKNALKRAKAYLGFRAFSRDRLIAQLEHEGFTRQQAEYGVDNSGANWNEQAAKRAKAYLDFRAFSRDRLIAQLEHEGFTRQQAEYGVRAVGY